MEFLQLFENKLVLEFSILSAIPLAVFALWADYFLRGLERLEQENTEYSPRSALGQIRILGWVILVSELVIYWNSDRMKEAHPWAALVIFLSALVVQSVFQGRLETRVLERFRARQAANHSASKESIDEGGLEQSDDSPLRPLTWIFAVLGGYFITVNALIWGTVMMGQWLGARPDVLYLLGGLGCLLGVIFGLFLSFALSPFYLKKIFPVEPLQQGMDLQSTLDRSFERAGVSTPDVWLLRSDRLLWSQPILAGFRSGRGVFKAAFFVPEVLTKALDPIEFDAVILNEASRYSLNQYPRRFVHSIGVVLMSMALSVVLVVGSHLLLPPEGEMIFKLIAVILAFWMPFQMVRRQSDRMQLEADLYSVQKLGVGFKELSRALRKLDVINERLAAGWESLQKLEVIAGNPFTERRIRRLFEAIERLDSKPPVDDVKKSA